MTSLKSQILSVPWPPGTVAGSDVLWVGACCEVPRSRRGVGTLLLCRLEILFSLVPAEPVTFNSRYYFQLACFKANHWHWWMSETLIRQVTVQVKELGVILQGQLKAYMFY